MHDENKIKSRMSIHELQEMHDAHREQSDVSRCIYLSLCQKSLAHIHLSFTSAEACFRESVGFVMRQTPMSCVR